MCMSLCLLQASNPAKTLLEEKDRKKFFQKYSSVSQELEKCLDCLLLISDSVTALGEEDTLGTCMFEAIYSSINFLCLKRLIQ